MEFIRRQVFLLAAAVSLCASGCGSAAPGPDTPAYDGTLRFEDGMAQPMVVFSPADTDNHESDILRFCVYVETDHDTDGDGKADLVKTFIQLPKSAAEGKYKAAALYDPMPYVTGTIDNGNKSFDLPFETEPFDKTKLYEPGEKRESAGMTDTLTAALEADSSQWIYTPPGNTTAGYYLTAMYDYFLVRGFAVVECAGIGTFGSEGFELCGTDLERDSHKAVVEWLAGSRRAFTDKEHNIEIYADWCNHNIAMTGTSYGGTLPFEVATTGVEGLKTIIPVAGISNWYNYANSQGVSLSAYPHYSDTLAAINAGNLFLDDEWLVPNIDYISWLRQQRADEEAANGNYNETWAALDYSDDYETINCSALVISGLNDFNVMTTHPLQMYECFKKAGQNVKLVFHQDGHNSYLGKPIGEELSNEVINKWLCHYLYDLDNGIESMPEVWIQSNLDGSFTTYDSWNDIPLTAFSAETKGGETVIHSGTFDNFAQDQAEMLMEEYYRRFDADHLAVFDLTVPEGSLISGTPEIHIRLSTEDTDQDNLMVTAALVDVMQDGSYFKAYNLLSNNARLPRRTVSAFEIGEGHDKGKFTEYVQSYTDLKLISIGWADLLDPEARKFPALDTAWHTAQAGEYSDYTITLTPTEYTLDKGHKLQLYVFAQDPYRTREDDGTPGYISLDKTDEVYSFRIDNDSVEAALPVR